MNDKQIYSWFEFEEDVKKIAAWARLQNFKSVYGIPRGGLVLAVKLSHLLDIPLTLHREDITPATLVVDDIVDKGATLERFLFSVDRNCCIASIFLNETSSQKPSFFVRKKERWVVFPWETEETSRYDTTV